MKSPSGSNFPYYYKDGIIHGIHFSNYKDDITSLLRILTEEEAFIKNQSITSTTWLDCYSIKYSKDVFLGICSFLKNLSGKVTKCALVGISLRYKIRINSFLKRNHLEGIQVRYYSDPEIAKTWLVGKLH